MDKLSEVVDEYRVEILAVPGAFEVLYEYYANEVHDELKDRSMVGNFSSDEVFGVVEELFMNECSDVIAEIPDLSDILIKGLNDFLFPVNDGNE